MKKSGIEVIVDTIVDNVPTHKLLSLSNIFEDGCWKQENIQSFIKNHISEAALSAKERNALIQQERWASITDDSIKNLRQSLSDDKAGELAEICLYGIMKRHYSALPLVPKIFYKQNPRDYAKGADSVHLVINNDDFSIWLGESKFYSDLSDAFSPALTSILELLNTSKLKKENSIITNLKELDELQKQDPRLTLGITEQIRSFFDDSGRSIDTFKAKLHVPIFILHKCELTETATELSDEYRQQLVKKHNDAAIKFFTSKIKELKPIYKIDSIHFHLILLPFPDKSQLVDWYQNSFLGINNAK